jgi:hypothetical protein
MVLCVHRCGGPRDVDIPRGADGEGRKQRFRENMLTARWLTSIGQCSSSYPQNLGVYVVNMWTIRDVRSVIAWPPWLTTGDPVSNNARRYDANTRPEPDRSQLNKVLLCLRCPNREGQ